MYSDELVALIRDSVRLVPDPAVDLAVMGVNRLGGEPELPEGVGWPEGTNGPLSFIAQVNLEHVPPGAHMRFLPTSGLLSFFYDAVTQSAWGFDPADRNCWAVLYSPAALPRRRRPAPANLTSEGRFTPLGLTGVREECFPPWESHDLERLGIETPWSTYAPVLGDRDEETIHRLVGHPDPVQGDMQHQCQLASNGIYCGNGKYMDDPRARELMTGSSDWRLLLQVDSSESETGMMWGDLGRIYFWMRETDLRDGNWSSSWLVLQCG